ncbi:hypothetical protein PYW07_016975 [Mythimna separata]|uniref:tRNA-splicing endonuclease subunit Sen54 N-terminal domain-containing protein n=1 Tax=Mythimna separata TaxID=271217 RepID=A0AAD7YX75_MYTSE|nr:hypothetical protein PYW07_016975 [Mythimna separata]
MEKPRVLSGEALVAKGITKIDASLPEVGLKDATPNGSWLEQKQIQAALEARKYLIEVERIEKCGTLSHAEWHDDLMLAEVTQKAGGHWQYLGHNVGKTLYLRPEEALFLMEVNCLLLKHNEVPVSLQKAYSLLLSSSTSMIQYKVYASLSRLGYRVFRHMGPKVYDEKNTCSKKDNRDEITGKLIAMGDESKQLTTPTAVVCTVNKSEKAEPLVSTLNNSENVSPPTVATVNVSENEDSSIVNTVVEPVKAETDLSKVNTVETVPDTEMVDTLKVEIVEKPENGSPMTSEVIVNEQETMASQEEEKGSEINGNIIEQCEVKDEEEMAEQINADNSVAKENESPNIMEVDDNTELKTADVKAEIETIQEVSSSMNEINEKVENTSKSMEICTENQEAGVVLEKESEHISNGIIAVPAEEQNTLATADIPPDLGTQTIEDSTKCTDESPNYNEPSYICTSNMSQKVYFSKDSYLRKIDKLTNRQLKPSDSQNIGKYFENIPDFSNKRVATINVPEQQFIPKNIYVNKRTYTLNLQNIKMRSVRSVSSESPAYTSSDEVNGTNIRRIRSSSDVLSTEYSQNPTFNPHVRFQNLPRYHHFRPYGAFWRPQNNLNFFHQLMFLQTRFQYQQRPHLMFRPPCFGIPPNNLYMSNNARKRMRNGKFAHFQGIRNLAVRLKQSLISGHTDMANLQTLHSLLHSYNLRYKTRLRLTETFDVVNEEKIVETIDLDDDEETKTKKPRQEKDDDDKFDENLYRLKQLALRLRDLEANDNATASHRRAFSKAIKTFNKSYDADIYLDDVSYEVIDRRCITLDSSSESDCVVEEQQQVRPKKLRNPFNILKRRKERLLCLNKAGTSKDEQAPDPSQTDPGPAEGSSHKYSESLVKTFNETWLPNENDFGRAEVVPKRLLKSRLEFSAKEQFLYEYKNDQFQNWLETKISFLKYLEETNIAFKREQARILADVELCNTGLKPLIDFEDSSDMPSVLEKLRIIENNKELKIETSLRIDFDVYNRNVQNFRKRNPPKPHFRIICLDESSGVPSAAHVMSLHSKYDDNVPIVFAIVSIGSISYLQINPIDLPIYVPNNDAV